MVQRPQKTLRVGAVAIMDGRSKKVCNHLITNQTECNLCKKLQ